MKGRVQHLGRPRTAHQTVRTRAQLVIVNGHTYFISEASCIFEDGRKFILNNMIEVLVMCFAY